MPISQAQGFLDARAALLAALQFRHYTPPSEAGLRLLLGQGFGESGFGRSLAGFSQTMAGTNNVGSIIAGVGTGANHGTAPTKSGWIRAHATPGFGMFAHPDTTGAGPEATAFVQWFRILPNQFQGWLSYVDTVARGNWPAVLAALDQGGAAYAAFLRSHGYYTTTVEAYTKMLQGDAAQAGAALATAARAGLQAADPTTAGVGETAIPPVSLRFQHYQHLLPSVNPSSGLYFPATPPLPVSPEPGPVPRPAVGAPPLYALSPVAPGAALPPGTQFTITRDGSQWSSWRKT